VSIFAIGRAFPPLATRRRQTAGQWPRVMSCEVFVERSQVRTEFGLQRTACACERCSLFCRHMPGYLVPSDLERLIPPGEDPFVWAKIHLRAVMPVPGGFPNLVPAQLPNGHCHWLEDGKCAVWQNSPFGCAFFDQHMGREEHEGRNAWGRAARQEAFEKNGLYAQLWHALKEAGLVRAGRSKEVNMRIRAELEQIALRERAGRPAAAATAARPPVVELVTYAGVPCRRLHQQMRQAERKFGESLTVHYLPVPMCPQCNPFVEQAGRGEHLACEYARLAWAVRLVDAGMFRRYHDWLMDREEPPRLAEAHRYALTLVNPDALQYALAGPELAAELEKAVQLYGAAGRGPLPKLIAGRMVLNGEPNEDSLFHFLEHYLGRRPAPVNLVASAAP
jgi:hypothetical protein